MTIFGWGKKGKEFDILKDFKGVAKPGEMVLVLGKPGSGCTTFLKTISNQRFGYTGFEGEVQYGPFGHEEFGKRYRGEAVYNEEDDIHHATLTVGQTLNFALDTKTPGKRPAGMSREDFKKTVSKPSPAKFTAYSSHILTPNQGHQYAPQNVQYRAYYRHNRWQSIRERRFWRRTEACQYC